MYSGPTAEFQVEFLVVDTEFDGDYVIIYLTPVNNLKDDPYVLCQSITDWLDWSQG